MPKHSAHPKRLVLAALLRRPLQRYNLRKQQALETGTIAVGSLQSPQALLLQPAIAQGQPRTRCSSSSSSNSSFAPACCLATCFSSALTAFFSCSSFRPGVATTMAASAAARTAPCIYAGKPRATAAVPKIAFNERSRRKVARSGTALAFKHVVTQELLRVLAQKLAMG